MWEAKVEISLTTCLNTKVNVVRLQMRNWYLLEGIADWPGASFAYIGSWDIQKWLWENMPKITLHSETAAYVREKLDMLGYTDTVFMHRFAHEPN